MAQSPITFRKPPLQETALCVQFDPLPGLVNPLLGVFWGECLSRDYSKLEDDAPPIEPQFERFGPDVKMGPRLPRLRIGGSLATRVRTTTPGQDRMVQIQNGRLAVNWLRGDGNTYPRFSASSDEFFRVHSLLNRFIDDHGMGPIKPNQWEVTYVNHIEQGSLWSTARDLPELLPGLLGVGDRVNPGVLESIESSWRFELPGQAGRLHIDLTHGWTASRATSPQLLVLQLTARGPVESEGAEAIRTGLNRGHDAIVETFAHATCARAHALWERVS